MSPWPEDKKQREISHYVQASILDSIESYSVALFTRVLGWSLAETQAYLTDVVKDLRNTDYHLYSKCHFVHGRKPKRP